MLMVAEDMSTATGTTRLLSFVLVLGALRTLSSVILSVVFSPSTSTVATATYSPTSTSPGTSVAREHSEIQSRTSHARPSSAQPVSFVHAESVREVAWKDTSAVISLSSSPSYSTGKGFTETGKVWWGSWTRLLR